MATIIHLKPSAKAKAELQAAITKDQQAAALQEQSPLTSREVIKGFAAQHPKAFHLLGVLFTTWRGSSSRRPGLPGYWAAYTYQEWSNRAKMPIATLKRQLNLLEVHGLIERVRGHHQGTRVVTFMRPTPLALKLSSVRPTDWGHLGVSPNEPKADPGKPKAFKSTPVAAVPQPHTIPDDDPAPGTLEELLAITSDTGTEKAIPTSSPVRVRTH